MTAELATLVETLLELADAEQRPAAAALLHRTGERRLRVLVAGEAKRGKSTLLNRLLERDLLPTGVLPVTAVSTTVRYGERDELRVNYHDGRREQRTLDELAGFVTEQANPDNRLGVAAVEACLATGRFAGHPVELVDTPGTGSIFEHNTAAARDAYAGLDAVIMVVTATPPMNAAERALLAEVSKHAVHTFVVLNKADQLSGDELAETVQFTEQICGQAGVHLDQIYPMSARDADTGFTTFRAAFETYLRERADDDSERALRGHAVRLAQGIRDEVAIELRAVEMAGGDSRERLTAFTDHLTALAAQAGELADRCAATERRLRRELGEHARELHAELVARCRAATDRALDVIAAADEIERRGSETVERLVTEAVLGWRDTQARRLEQRVAQLVDVVETERARHLDALRQAASGELGIEITAGIEPLPLQAGRLFWLDFAPPPAVELPGAELLRRHGPGAARRARQRVFAGIPEVVDRQIGRARADLQYRLGETGRQLVAALRTHHADMLTRLQQALGRAADATEQTAQHTEHELARLRDRIDRIDDLIVRLA